MKTRVLLTFFFIVLSVLFIYASFIPRSEEVRISVNFPILEKPEHESLTIKIPERKHREKLTERIGKELWSEIKEAFRQGANLSGFMPGDIIVVDKVNKVPVRFSLHNYENTYTGKKIQLTKKQDGFEKKVESIALMRRKYVHFFEVKTSLKNDYPVFYEELRKELLWDWGFLDSLIEGDSVAVVIDGVFDGEILYEIRKIHGIFVKSSDAGDFALTNYTDKYYGHFFISDADSVMSPPGEFRLPIDYGRITSHFGYRRDPFTGRRRFHNGIDIIARRNTSVRAAADGRVIQSGWKGNFGKTVVIQHEDGKKTLYAHLNRINIRAGQNIRMGEIIGGAGKTGRSTASHLHFTVYEDGKAVDPLSYTYERIWTPPFDIARSFRYKSVSMYSAMLDSMSENRSFFLEDYLAKK
ncbi:MAG: M23 family metallopeptidase [bacterium]